ncbi:roundabout homolog 1 isoform X2 [Megalops cyprinoides]|uniref:roundabout homolog 1 isoform X2 n=1 Tax=Megalops cyprinoides TaxID=118141 RepID=UPI001863DEA2|nr:roundabout homolog 1 isoform X2 [Megalops cyprinoides]
MQVATWLLWASWLCTWAEGSRRCQCQCTCLPGPTASPARAHGRGHAGHHEAHQRPHLRHRAHRRKGSRQRPDEVPPRIVHHPSDVVVRVGSPATLSCRAEGTPEPTIEWLRNGLPLEMDKLESQSRPIVLSEGSLFFLSVVPGRRGQSHEGVYTCVAQNSAGKAMSRNATLHIAALRDEFRVQPSDVEVAVGEVAVMNCTPPTGHPEPNVTWKKDGVPINCTDEHYTVFNGKLVIAPTQKNDSGVYVCVASNTVGVRESRAARLSVLARPVFTRKPLNVTARIGDSVRFLCEAQGDPMPLVQWTREQGSLPHGRYEVNPGHSLEIHYVTAQDTGRYTCTAVNEVGVSSASASLVVQDALNVGQKELHTELSAMRVALENVTILSPSSNRLQLQWRLQSSPLQPHHLDGFEVLYRSLLPASSDWAAQRVTLPHYQAVIGPLKRGYKYELKVRPYGGNLYGRESNTKHLRVPELVPSAPPQGIAVTMAADRNDTIHVSWDPPPHEAHNGIIQSYQVWCLQSGDQRSPNWTIGSGTHSLEIGSLEPGKQYWVTVAAVNGAGIGVKSDPHKLILEPLQAVSPHQRNSGIPAQVLAVVRDPVFIGSVGALLWCVLMVTAVCLYRRHTRPSHLRHSHRKGLYRLASEDLIIKHRMAAPDSPWMSGAWRSAPFNEPYHSLWAQSQENPGFRKTTLPAAAKKDPSPLETAVPIVPDSCGVYGTFYVDLTGNGLKTFNSPARRPKAPHTSSPRMSETVRFSQPIFKTAIVREGQVLPWKRALPAQPNMGVIKESWEKNYKRELHAVNSAPLVPTRQQSLAVQSVPSSHAPRFGQRPPGGLSECAKPLGSPRVLHYSASLHLIDVLPTPPPLPLDDTHSLSSEEESSRSTKLTVDGGSLRSMGTVSGLHGPPTTAGCPSYSRLSTASFCMSVDDEQDTALSAQEVAQYLELSPKVDRRSVLPDSPASIPRPFSPTPTFGYICGPLPSDLDTEDVSEEPDAGRSQQLCSRRSRLRSTPSSCGSEWEGSLWNGWGSVSEGNMPSARASLISSSDGSFMNDANFARVLAVAAESMGGAAFSDFSPPASPLSALFPPRECFGELDPLPVWDWSTAWVEEIEAQYRSSRGARGVPGRDKARET